MTISERVEGGKVFRAVWELVGEAEQDLTPAGRENFWQAFQDAMREKFPDPRDKQMSDEELRIFGAQPMPFGRCAGESVNTVDFSYLQWISRTGFVDKLRQYLKHPTIAKAIAVETNQKYKEFYDGNEEEVGPHG